MEKQAESKWGDGFFKNLSTDLQSELPGVKGLSIQNLYYAKKFYLLYSQVNIIFPQVEGKIQKHEETSNFPQVGGNFENLLLIPWGHHRYIIDKCQDMPEKAFFYVQQTIANNWSRAMLQNFLDTNPLFFGILIPKPNQTLGFVIH